MSEQDLREAQQQKVTRCHGYNHTPNHPVRAVSRFSGAEFSIGVKRSGQGCFHGSLTFEWANEFPYTQRVSSIDFSLCVV